MELFEAIAARHSCRAYANAPATRAELEKIVAAGRLAPTAMNTQPWEMVVVTDAERRSALAELVPNGKFIGAPGVACIAVFTKPTKYYLEDCCGAVVTMLLAATGLGLDTCWVAGDKKVYVDAVGALLGAPSGTKLVALIGVGHAEGNVDIAPKRPLEDVIHWERF
ncbi:MAG: nitroreductase family protein [Myxococcales bacterium]|jgi:nitroreductase|nr:nitroreductase family protein [Myxococcales bacterium]